MLNGTEHTRNTASLPRRIAGVVLALTFVAAVIPPNENYVIRELIPAVFVILSFGMGAVGLVLKRFLLFFALAALVAAAVLLVCEMRYRISARGKERSASSGASPAGRTAAALRRIAGGVITRVGIPLALFYVAITGLVMMPRFCRPAILAGLAVVWFFRGAVPAGQRVRRPALYLMYAIIAAAIIFILDPIHKRIDPVFESILFIAAGAGAVRRAGKSGWGEFKAAAPRTVLWVSAAAGAIAIASYVISIQASMPDAKHLRRVADITDVYDLKADAEHGRLFFSSRAKPELGYIDLKTGRVTAPKASGRRCRRIAVFPNRNRFFNGGEKTVEFSIRPPRAVREVHDRYSISLENMGGESLLIVREFAGELMIYDLETGRLRKAPLGILPPWPYAVKYSPELDYIFVSNWLVSPYIVKLDGERLRARRRLNGLFNMDMCVMPEKNELFVARPIHRRVDVIDARFFEKLREIPMEFGIREIECDEKRNLIFALNQGTGALIAADTRSGETMFRTNVGHGARALEYDGGSRTLYAGSESGIFVVDVRNAKR